MTLAISPALRRWLMQDAAWRAQPLAWRARQAWLAALGGANLRLSAATLAQRPAAGLQDPLFVAGPWRSGTTVMHELLAAATGLATPRTWQCMDACAFVLPQRKRSEASVARPMDGLAIGAESPQEDEFALLALGVESAYRAFWLPHRLGDLHHTLDPAFWSANDATWLAPWEDFLRGVIATTPAARQPLLLKSPNHGFRAPALARRFPGARWVWMMREPAAVFHSNRKMWTQMFALHGLAEPQPGALDAFLATALERSAEVLQQALDRLPGRFAFVAHEALLAQPAATVTALLAQLELPPADATALDAAIRATANGRVERYADAALPPQAAAACARLAEAQRAALDVQYLRHAA